MTAVDERQNDAQAALFPLPDLPVRRWVQPSHVDEPRTARPVHTVYALGGVL